MKIERVRGDTYADSFTVTNSRTNAPADLTGCQFLMTLSSVSNPVDESDQLYQLVGEIDDDPTTGVVNFAPTAEQADLVGYFFFDIQMIDTLGIVRTLVKDTYTYVQDITK